MMSTGPATAKLLAHLARSASAVAVVRHLVGHLPGLAMLWFRRGPDGRYTYVQGTDDEWVNIQTAPAAVVGLDCQRWLEEIGAGDIFPLYDRCVDGRKVVPFRYELGGMRSFNTLIPVDRSTGLLLSLALESVEAAYAGAPLPDEVHDAS